MIDRSIHKSSGIKATTQVAIKKVDEQITNDTLHGLTLLAEEFHIVRPDIKSKHCGEVIELRGCLDIRFRRREKRKNKKDFIAIIRRRMKMYSSHTKQTK